MHHQNRFRVNYFDIQFKDNDDGAQRRRYKKLFCREILPTRYVDDLCLRTLGLYENVYFMLDKVSLCRFSLLRHKTYKRLMLDFLSSYEYSTWPCTRHSISTVIFCMFNLEYSKTLNEVAGLL